MGKLQVQEVFAGGNIRHSDRRKRPLSLTDLDPKLMADNTADVDLFFHANSKAWYDSTGRPYRHGYLLYGPPGTGKTSLSAALASHCDVPLFIVSQLGMDDNQLKQAFGKLTSPSVVLIEDIDCAGADIKNRGAHSRDMQWLESEDEAEDVTPEELSVESMFTRLVDNQKKANAAVLREVAEFEKGNQRNHQQRVRSHAECPPSHR